MKTFTTTILTTVIGLLLVVAVPLAQAGEIQIPEVENADFEKLAQDAVVENKQLMIVYYRNQCDTCEQLMSMQGSSNIAVNKINQQYKIYKTNVINSFDVVCPSGEIYSEDEFLAIKGITAFPAVVITDESGNVEVVENSIKTGHQLLAIEDLFKTRDITKYTTADHLN